jgi:tetratricopeptide (TPR) repeat protein
VLAISVFNLQEVWTPDKNLFGWLHNRTPVAKIGYSIYVYDLTGDVEAHLRLAEAYIKTGLLSQAASELQKVLALDPSNSEATWFLSLLSQKPRPVE